MTIGQQPVSQKPSIHNTIESRFVRSICKSDARSSLTPDSDWLAGKVSRDVRGPFRLSASAAVIRLICRKLLLNWLFL